MKIKIELNCEHYKPEKKGVKDKCACKYLNRNKLKYLNIWNQTIEHQLRKN